MTTSPRQLPLPFKKPHGGRRKGAGRKNRSGRRGHVARAQVNPRHPAHVTLKIAPGLPHLKRKEMFKCLRAAVRTARKSGFGVVHFSILSNHIHFILEPQDSRFGSQMRSLCVSFAKRVNARLGRRGAVFFDRYHLNPLETPTKVRNALEYVLTNEHIHAERGVMRAGAGTRRAERVEISLGPYSSALSFANWRELLGRRAHFLPTRESDDAIEAWHSDILVPAKTWLLSIGWLKAKARE